MKKNIPVYEACIRAVIKMYLITFFIIACWIFLYLGWYVAPYIFLGIKIVYLFLAKITYAHWQAVVN